MPLIIDASFLIILLGASATYEIGSFHIPTPPHPNNLCILQILLFSVWPLKGNVSHGLGDSGSDAGVSGAAEC